MKKHYLVLDSFRGICACIVAMSHFNANSIFLKTPILNTGSIYVDFFFVLSGFVIFASYADKFKEGFELKKFVFLRFGRLYPLHFFVLLAFILTEVFQLFFLAPGAAAYPPFSAPGESPSDILAMFLLVHSLHLTHDLAFNVPSWSISVEFYTYIIFGLILTHVHKFQNLFIALLGLTSAIILYHLSGELFAKLDYGIFRCIYGFACGALTWKLFNNVSTKLDRHIAQPLIGNALEISLVGVCLVYIQFFIYGAFTMVAPLLLSAMIFVFAFEKGSLSSFLKKKIFLFVGMLSYSIYMVHIFISGKFFALPVRLLEGRLGWDLTVDINGTPHYGHTLLQGTSLEIFYLLVVIGCSYISFKLIEEPFRKWSKEWVRNDFKLPAFLSKK